jgi:hypothetical protein
MSPIPQGKMNHGMRLYPLPGVAAGALFFWHFPRYAAINHTAILSVNQIIVLPSLFCGIEQDL